MAEVYTAKSFGIEGFEKIIAIKRILPTMAEDEDFIRMFIDEAKIAGHLTHANIVPIYELGKIGESHYIAMEYVWGKDLLQIMNRFRRMRKHMPPVMAAWIASKMCEGLDFAHRKRDRHGNPLNIVHRDVSPQNVLVSYEGQVKLIDFGIAKAAARNTKTQAGVLKGKFGYMSPEQVRGIGVDHRSDIFAVGTCLHEMLTGERLFVGESDFSTLEKVRNAEVVPPSTMVPDVPKELEQIVLKALAREVEDRWQSAGEMHEALQMFIAKEKPPFGTSKLAAWMRTAFAAEMAKEKARLDAFAKITKPASVPPPPPGRASAPSAPRKLPPPPPPPRAAVAAADVPSLDADEEEDELRGEATVISSSPFEEMLAAGGTPDNAEPEDLQGAPTQIFFSALEMEEAPPGEGAPNAAPGAARLASGPNVVVNLQGEPAPTQHGPTLSSGAPPQVPVDHASALGTAPAPHGGSMGVGGPMGAGPSPFPAPPGAAPAPFAAPASDAPDLHARPRAGGLETMELRAPTLQKSRTGLYIGLGIGGVVALAAAALAFFMFGGSSGGTIEIWTVPPVAATVFVDGTERGPAPLRLEHVPAGDHLIEVRVNGQTAATQTVRMREGGVAMVQLAIAPTTLVAQGGGTAASPLGLPPAAGPAAAAAAAAATVAPTAAATPAPPTATPTSTPAATPAPPAATPTPTPAATPAPPTATPTPTPAATPAPPTATPTSTPAATPAPPTATPTPTPAATPAPPTATPTPTPAAPPQVARTTLSSSSATGAAEGHSRPGSTTPSATSTSAAQRGGSPTAASGGTTPTSTPIAPTLPRRLSPEEAERALSATSTSTGTSAGTSTSTSGRRGDTGGGTSSSASSSRGTGYLMIQTLPWARVFVDGRDTGQNTPIRRMAVPAGSHRIGLRTNDGRMHEVTVDVPAGETVRIVRQL
jgi:serine/threonine protein kinase